MPSLHLPHIAILIPARYGSSRFPGKPLAQLAGKPLIQHVYEAAAEVPRVTQVQVVTDDPRIVQAVNGFGGEVSVVDSPCRTGTDRVAAVASQLNCQIIVNWQADEIPLHPGLLDDLLEPFLMSDAHIGTLKRLLTQQDDLLNPSIVKVVTDTRGEALYFSRSPIPFLRDGKGSMVEQAPYYSHLGIYVYRRDILLRFAELPAGVLEETEQLEQLRALEHGYSIQVWETQHPSLRIDRPEDLEEASHILTEGARQ